MAVQIVSDDKQKLLETLLTFDELVGLVLDNIPEAKAWRNPTGTIKQAMYRGKLESFEKPERGRKPLFTTKAAQDYLAYLKNRPAKGGPVPTIDISKFDPLLGLKTDRTIAILAQCSQNVVYKRRRWLNIPSSQLLDPEKRRFATTVSESELAQVGMTLETAQNLLTEAETKAAEAKVKKSTKKKAKAKKAKVEG
jgi:hypothetical protein